MRCFIKLAEKFIILGDGASFYIMAKFIFIQFYVWNR